MAEVWWFFLGAVIPVVVAGQSLRVKEKRADERLTRTRGRENKLLDASINGEFVCERVCTSKRMIKKIGSSSTKPMVDACATVCGVSKLDACVDACVRGVCVNQHRMPNWDDVCLQRCQSECLKLWKSSQISE
ncbi:hypothetical protein UlMin_034711 [Ulmus minor]